MQQKNILKKVIIVGLAVFMLAAVVGLSLFAYYRAKATLLTEVPEITEVEAVVPTVAEEVHEATEPEEIAVDHNNAEDVSEKEIVSEEENGLEEEIPTEEEIVLPTATIVMVGDILLHTPVEDSARNEEGEYDFSAIFANVKEEIEAADVAIVNEEVILGGKELGISGYPAFNGPYEVADALVDNGFDVICHATNHAVDKGKKGLLNCMTYWADNYPEIDVLGIHDSKEDQDIITVKEVNGIRIAFLNYTYGTNGIPLPEDMPYCVDLLEEERVTNDLKAADALADFTVVCPHWGTEYQLDKTQMQEKWARIFFDGGADLVLGTHPHVIEPIEWMEQDDKQMLIYYSLGNFVNWTSGTGDGVANRMVGGMAQIEITKDENGNAFISNYGVLPLVAHVKSGYGNVTTYPLDVYSEELANENEIISQDASFSYEYVNELIDKVWPDIDSMKLTEEK